MTLLYDNAGDLITHNPDAPCTLCGNYDDNKEGKGNHPVFIALQAFGGLLSFVALAFVNLYILPEGTWERQETAFLAVFIMLPSIVLIVFLFAYQILGMHEQWMRIVIWIIGSSFIMSLLMFLMDSLLEMPALVGGGS